MFWPTAVFILVVLFFAVVVGGVIYFGISPFNAIGFYVTGKITDPFYTLSANEINKTGSQVAAILMNASQPTTLVTNVANARSNDQVLWLIFPILAFAGGLLFFFSQTDIRKGGKQ